MCIYSVSEIKVLLQECRSEGRALRVVVPHGSMRELSHNGERARGGPYAAFATCPSIAMPDSYSFNFDALPSGRLLRLGRVGYSPRCRPRESIVLAPSAAFLAWAIGGFALTMIADISLHTVRVVASVLTTSIRGSSRHSRKVVLLH